MLAPFLVLYLGTVWYGMARYEMVWHGMAWYALESSRGPLSTSRALKLVDLSRHNPRMQVHGKHVFGDEYTWYLLKDAHVCEGGRRNVNVHAQQCQTWIEKTCGRSVPRKRNGKNI